MKLEKTKNYIFLNITPNLLKIARIIETLGRNTYFFSINDIHSPVNNKILYLHNNSYLSFSEGNFCEENYDAASQLIEKTMFSLIRHKTIKKELIDIDEAFIIGNIKDLMLLKRKKISKINTYPHIQTIDSYNRITADYDDVIISNKLYYDTQLSKNMKNYMILSLYETDFDLYASFGEDYFVIFYNFTRVEIYVYNKFLCIIHYNIIEPINLLFLRYPFLKKFNFKKVESLNLIINDEPWLISFESKNTILINDYSFNNLSVDMPEKWYESIGRFLCSGNL